MPDIVRDGSLAGGIPGIPEFRPVERDVFAERAQRLAALAPEHALQDYLAFAAALSEAQDAALRALPAAPVPDAATLQHCHAHGLPPLSVDGHRRDAAWRSGLTHLIEHLDPAAMPAQVQRMLAELRAATPDALEAAAGHVLAGAFAELKAGEGPFLAAALQVYWVRMALALGRDGFSAKVKYGLCPVCGSHPVASVVRIGGAQQGLRYLVCSLCASEWHVVRVKCSACASTKGISYLGIEGGSEAVKAEVCDECKTYLKIFYLEKNSSMEPVADDLATLALDMLVDEAGYNRVGPNLLFVPGAAATE